MKKSLLLFFILLIPAAAQSHDPDKPLRIAMSRSFPPLTFINAEGNPAGLFVDMWKLWAEKTGQKIEFLLSSWSESIENLKNGSADIHSGLAITPEREEWMSFSHMLYENSSCLFFPVTQGKSLTVKELSGQRTGVIQNSSTEEWLKKNYPDMETVPFKSTEEAILSASRGEVRALADSCLSTSADITRLGFSGEFECCRDILYTKTLHAGVLKENPALLNLIDKGFDAISDNEFHEMEKRWIPDPEKRYFRPGTETVRLTPEEQAWLREHPKIRIHAPDGFPPESFWQENRFQGILRDFTDIVSQRTGISFEFVNISNALCDEKMERHEIDVRYTFEIPQRREKMLFSNPFVKVGLVIVSRSDMPFLGDLSRLKGYTVAVVKGMHLYARMLKDYPDIRFHLVSSPDEGLKSVASGHADVFINSPASTAYFMRREVMPYLRIDLLTEYPPEPFMFAIRRDWPQLLSIMNKGIARIAQADRNAIFDRWVPLEVQHAAYWVAIRKWAGGIGGVAVLIFGLTLYWNRKLAKEIAERRRIEESLKEKDVIFQAFMENSPIYIFFKDHNIRSLQLSRNYEKMLGMPLENILGKNMDELFPSDLAKSMIEDDKKILYEGKLVQVDEELNGRHYTTIKFPVDMEGKPRMLAGFTIDITDRIRAEQALRESEARWQFALEGIGDGVWDWNVETHTVFFSNQWKKMLGYEPDEIGNSLEEWDTRVHPDDRDDVYRQIEKHLSGQSPVYWSEHRVCCKDGTWKWILDSGKIMSRTPDGRPLRIIGTHKDITDRKRTEEALRQSEERFRAIFEHAAVGIALLEADSKNIVMTNPAIERFMGYTEAELRELGVAAATHPDDWDADIRLFTELMEGKHRHYSIEKRYVRKDGQILWGNLTVSAIRDGAGNLTHVIGMVEDITERKKTEDQLREKECLLSDIINFLPDAMFVIDTQGKVLAWNRAMETMTGIKAGDILGKGNYEYAIPFYGERRPILIDLAMQPSEEIEKIYRMIQRKGDTMMAEHYYPNLLGKETWLFGNACILRNSQGEIIGAIESIRDITHRKFEDMELRKAKDAAESATRAKSEFLANMSHEIRTPMNAVVNMTRLLLDTKLDEDQRDYAETAAMSSEILLSLISDILDFSKIEAGKLELEKTDFSLKNTVASVIKILRPKAEEKGLFLRCSLDSSLPSHVSGDPVRVRQILLNFLNNAVKFTENGGIGVRVFRQDQTDTHCTVKFEVTDTGIGIPENRRTHLFQPFSQLDTSTSRRYGGTGLGLVISKQLAELMGGSVGVESQEGEGSTFWFTARMQKAEYEIQKNHNDSDMLDSKTETAHSSLRILLAEDNLFNQKVALAVLKKSGFSADLASNGRDAVDALRKKHYDLVFMDIQMPEMDGIEAARIIRDSGSEVLNPRVPIVAMTANVTKEARQKCFEAGMNGYISKPIDTEKILSVISEQLSVISNQLSANREQLSEHLPVTSDSVTTGNCSRKTEIFNRQDFLNRMSGNEILLKEMIADIPAHFSEVMADLKNAADRGDTEKTGHLAHFLRGISANVSAERIRDIACQMETASKENAAETVQSLITRLEQEAQQFRSLLSEMYPEIFQSAEKHESDAKSEMISEQTKARLPELIRILEEEFLPEWEKYTEAFFIEETEKLAAHLKRMGVQYQLAFLIRYSEKVHMAVQQYNFSHWETLVAEFPEIMDRIRKLAKQDMESEQ